MDITISALYATFFWLSCETVFDSGPTEIAQQSTVLPNIENLKLAKKFVKMPDIMKFLETFVQSGNSGSQIFRENT